jgi:hypothetical protein
MFCSTGAQVSGGNATASALSVNERVIPNVMMSPHWFRLDFGLFHPVPKMRLIA